MRIPIREQLAGLILLAAAIGLAVISIATWVRLCQVHPYPQLLTRVTVYQPQLRPRDSYDQTFLDRIAQSSPDRIQPGPHSKQRAACLESNCNAVCT